MFYPRSFGENHFDGPAVPYNFQYGVFGEQQSGNTSIYSSPFGFTGRWGGYTDSRLGQVLNWNRWYGPEAGRWGSRDPLGIDGGENIYCYVRDESVSAIDVSGLCPTPNDCWDTANSQMILALAPWAGTNIAPLGFKQVASYGNESIQNHIISRGIRYVNNSSLLRDASFWTRMNVLFIEISQGLGNAATEFQWSNVLRSLQKCLENAHWEG